MTDQSADSQTPTKHTEAYRRMMERVKDTLGQAESGAAPILHKALDAAKEKAAELGELTREEAEEIGDYLLRDVHDAAQYISETGGELKDWLRFDLLLVEQRLLEIFSTMVDQTRSELDHLAVRAVKFGEWHTGEMAGVGTLQCAACGNPIHFNAPGHIPPCPHCRGTVFKRGD